jgi:hypothetical protein
MSYRKREALIYDDPNVSNSDIPAIINLTLSVGRLSHFEVLMNELPVIGSCSFSRRSYVER